jgi:pSer/pThr/pTyr-binding forkhead associated (FHA) protein
LFATTFAFSLHKRYIIIIQNRIIHRQTNIPGVKPVMWQFIIRTPERGIKIVDLKPGKLTLGLEETNDIVIEDISASRHHAEILFDPTTNIVSLIDLHSTNGTYVNRQQIKISCQLGPEDIIRIGQVVMQLNRQLGEKN